jgi:hypothetical protein
MDLSDLFARLFVRLFESEEKAIFNRASSASEQEIYDKGLSFRDLRVLSVYSGAVCLTPINQIDVNMDDLEKILDQAKSEGYLRPGGGKSYKSMKTVTPWGNIIVEEADQCDDCRNKRIMGHPFFEVERFNPGNPVQFKAYSPKAMKLVIYVARKLGLKVDKIPEYASETNQ